MASTADGVEGMGENVEKNRGVEGDVPKGWERDSKTGKLVPVKGEVLTFDFETPQAEVKKGAPPKSLQERFSSFRKEKIKAARSKAFQAEEESKQRQDATRMQELREKFIERCKAYYGVPYARRYHEPGTEHYNAALFLDCCGLVRQVLRDLKEDFGFTTGPWNQAYQFDTLPIRYDSWEQMKPGDLVFAEGKVTKPGLKQQKGNIVHVEVFLGGGPDGKSVCGARWGKGVVQEFETFDFKAKCRSTQHTRNSRKLAFNATRTKTASTHIDRTPQKRQEPNRAASEPLLPLAPPSRLHRVTCKALRCCCT